MNYLLIYAHPDSKSFCHAIKEEIETQIKKQGGTITVRDLYAMDFSTKLSLEDFALFHERKMPADIKKEQDLIREADRLIFVFPIWWFSMPAICKGYIDRVLTRGFAYDMKGHLMQGLLKGKQVLLFTPTGGPGIAYNLLGFKLALKVTIAAGIFKFCGMKVALHKFFYSVPTVSDEKRKKMLQGIKNIKF